MLQSIWNKPKRLAIGLMSGTSADGIDAVLVSISGFSTTTTVTQKEFYSTSFPSDLRKKILDVASGQAITAQELTALHFLLGQEYLKACLALCEKAGINPHEIDFVGTHGQTIHHQPDNFSYLGHEVRGTLQIGEPSLLAEKLQCVVVSDFRPRDMAAGGQGAPLVPYTDYLLYRSDTEHTALQNIGGIGNISFIPKHATLEDVLGFDTGPGNMLLDLLMMHFTNGKETYDSGGDFAATGSVSRSLLDYLMADDYLAIPPPKSTGREKYDQKYIELILSKSQDLSPQDIMATVTCYTAATISYSINNFLPVIPDRLIIGGGGSHNHTLLSFLREQLPATKVLINEDIGLDSDAKEAVAFAVLANETLYAIPNNAPSATGAEHPVVMGKISF